MKRFLACVFLFFLSSSAFTFAEDTGRRFPLTVDTFEGAYYNAQAIATDPADPFSFLSAMFSALYNLRGGVGIDFEARLGKIGGFGGEVGAYYFVQTDANDQIIASLLDLPYRLKLSLTAGSVFKLEVFGGVLFSMWIDSSQLLYYPYLDAGGRIALGPLYLEGGYEFPLGSTYEGYPRFGIGVLIPLSR